MDKTIIRTIIEKQKSGSFSLLNPIRFDYCRERFAGIFTSNQNEFLYACNENEVENVINFILKTESILNLEEKTIFKITNYKGIIHVIVPLFWRDCSLKRNLYTIFLRVGRNYKGDYKEALLKDCYASSTIDAIYRFLFGFTKYTGPPVGPVYHNSTTVTCGWVRIFKNKDRDFITKVLSSNENVFKTTSLKTLWI